MSYSMHTPLDGFVRLGIAGGPLWRGLNSQLLVPSDLANFLREEAEAAESELFRLDSVTPDEDLWEEIEAMVDAREVETLTRKVFDLDEIDAAIKGLEGEDRDVAKRYKLLLGHARAQGGERMMPSIKIPDLKAKLFALADLMPNFREVIEVLLSELSLALSGSAGEFRVTPIVLSGEPGIGKTRFVREFAAALGVWFEGIALATASAGFVLTGTTRAWGNSRPGLIAELMSQGRDATPVIMLDEIDKVSDTHHSPIIPALLELLEGESAKRFRDEGLEVRMDLGGVIFIATANDLEGIPSPLLSRLRVVNVRSPSAEEKLGIAAGISKQYEKYGLRFSQQTLTAIANEATDLRELQRLMRDSAGRALYEGVTEVVAAFPAVVAKAVHRMGFV